MEEFVVMEAGCIWNKVSGNKQLSDPTIRTSFPRASGGNPGVLKPWTPAKSIRG
jgi:hypothetical protein